MSTFGTFVVVTLALVVTLTAIAFVFLPQIAAAIAGIRAIAP